ncbi:cystathionine beta-lyase [Streptococcus suis]|nr:cystathionine beta-lyase [Streptococcus suis]
MTDYITLALTYGGFTSLDKVYLEGQLARLADSEKMRFITPPPSVINAYFAEHYQKQGPKAATDYFFQLSKALDLFQKNPSFTEEKPFVRLNLSGKAYGFAYEDASELAQVFPETAEIITQTLLSDIAQIFPDFKVYQDQGRIRLRPVTFDETILEEVTPESSLLSQVYRLKGGVIKVKSFNQDELAEMVATYQGRVYYGFSQREYLAYILKD